METAPEDHQASSNGHSIELPLSSDSRAALREKLCKIEGPWQIDEKFKPHLSFAVIREPTDVNQVAGLRELVQSVASDLGPFTIRLSAMGIFPGKRPVFTLMPAHHESLLAAHHRVADQLAAIGVSPIPYYGKHNWTPHVTIMMGRPRREVSAAMEGLSRVWWPGDYVLDEIELVEFHPAVKLEKLPLVGLKA